LRIGVIAGAGGLPVALAQEAKSMGRQVLVIGITKDIDERLRLLADEFHQISIGQLRKIFDALSAMDVSEVVIIGRVSKDLLFKPMHFDLKSMKILGRLRNKSDISLFDAIAEEMESAGFNLVDQRLYLSKLLPHKGVLTKQKPSKDQLKSIEYGMELARKVAELGIGQTVVLKDGIPLAIEAIEGTDETIRRGGSLCNGGAVVAKCARPGQDFRFDVPTAGPDTIDVLAESGASVLAIESGKAFLLEPEKAVQKANKARISLVVV